MGIQQVLLAASALSGGTAWDLTTASAGYTGNVAGWTIASGNRDIRNDAVATAAGGFKSTTSKATGKWYFELLATTAGLDLAVGVMSSAASPVNNPTTGTGRGDTWWRGNGQSFSDGITTYNGSLGAWANGDVIGVAVDVGTNVKFYKNNTLTATITFTTSSVVAFTNESTTSAVRGVGRFAAADQSYSPPAGYATWD